MSDVRNLSKRGPAIVLLSLLLLVIGIGQRFPNLSQSALTRSSGLQEMASPGRGFGNAENLSAKFQSLSFPVSESPRLIQMSTDGKALTGVSVSGNKYPFGSIILVDLDSGQTKNLADINSNAHPQISEKYVVWEESQKISVFNRKDGKTFTLDLPVQAVDPSLDQSILVWRGIDFQGHDVGIFGYDLDTSRSFPVVSFEESPNAYNPIVINRWVIFQRRVIDQNGNTLMKLNAKSLDSDVLLEVGDLPNPKGYISPLFAGSDESVVWVEWGNNPSLKRFDFVTRKASSILIPSCSASINSGRPSNLRMSINTVIFSGCGKDAMAYDISSDTFSPLVLNLQNQDSFSLIDWTLAGDRMVWSAMIGTKGNEKTDIFSSKLNSR